MTPPTPPPPRGTSAPVPVATLGGDGPVRSRLGREVPLPPSFAARLAERCPTTTDGATCAETSRDWWPISAGWALGGRAPAIAGAVARPTSAVEVAAVLALCATEGVPVTPVAGRSGVCGGAVPVFGGVALDLRDLAGITAVDDRSLLVEVRAGTWGDAFEAELRERHGLTCGHWPQSVAMSTVGGWLACRGAGQYSTRYGKIEDMVTGLEVALADGRVIRTGHAGPRSASGPDLTQLFVGSEGTLGVITSARLRVHPAPVDEQRATARFPDVASGLDACRRILRRGATPAVLRLYDAAESARTFDVDGCLLIVLDEGDPVVVGASMAVVAEELAGVPAADPAVVDRWLEHRNEVHSLERLAAGGVVADTIEVAAPWAALPSLYADAVAAVEALPATIAVSAHQSHAYSDGACLYFTFAGAPGDEARERYYEQAWDAVSSVTLARGGSLSHHHGIGINRGRHLAEALGGGFDVLRSVKAALDPAGVLNPGKLGLGSPWGPPPWPADAT